MTELAFWLLLLLGIYPYVLYPIAVALLGKVRVCRVMADDAYLPHVAVITAAFNEAHHIAATIMNKLNQDYPAERLHVLVVSDGSTDDTDEIVKKIATDDPRVTLIRNEPRQGKTAGLNVAVLHATAEILVFADANSIYRMDALRKLVRNFADQKVGYVTGRMLYIDSGGSLVGDGCSAYMKYENALRAAETRIGSVIGVDGGVDSVRKSLYRPMSADQLPDFVLPLLVAEQGYRVIYEPEAVLTEETLATTGSEYRMRVRVALRAMWALWNKKALLNPFKTGLIFSWQLWSHKLLRYMSFLPLAIAAVLNWCLISVGGMTYQLCLVMQVLFVLMVIAAAAGPAAARNFAPCRYSYYFFLLNWASAVAFWRFLRGHKQILWQPRTG